MLASTGVYLGLIAASILAKAVVPPTIVAVPLVIAVALFDDDNFGVVSGCLTTLLGVISLFMPADAKFPVN